MGQTFLSAINAASFPADRNVCPTVVRNACYIGLARNARGSIPGSEIDPRGMRLPRRYGLGRLGLRMDFRQPRPHPSGRAAGVRA